MRKGSQRRGREPAEKAGPVKTVALRGRVVTDYEVWPEGTVLIEENSIANVSHEPLEAAEIHEYPDCLVTPGFVDLQVNGSFGLDVATEPGRVPELSRKLVATGTTAYLPTLISSPATLYHEALPRLADLVCEGVPGGAEVLGAHLEGPFINAEKRGAHPAGCVSPADSGLLEKLLDLGPVRMLTLAPELEGAAELAEMSSERGVVVCAGHSNATFELACEAFDGGVAGVTHLFNAMSLLHHRKPGLPGAAFAHPRVTCSVIADGRHVHPEMVNLAFRMLGPDRLYLVTDAISATGAGSGEHRLATQRIHLDVDGVPTLESGEFAGSVLTMDEALRNILTFADCDIPEAVRMAATNPARLIGEGERMGRLASGYDANIAVLRPDLSVEAVYKGGLRAYLSDAHGGVHHRGAPRL